MIYSTTLRLYLCKGIFCKEGKHEDAEEQETCASCCGRTFSLCASRRRSVRVWNMYGKNAEENEKQIVSDEVAEIESLNSRDNVVDLEELSREKRRREKEDVTSEKNREERRFFDEVRLFSKSRILLSNQAGQKTGVIKKIQIHQRSRIRNHPNRTRSHQNRMNNRQNRMTSRLCRMRSRPYRMRNRPYRMRNRPYRMNNRQPAETGIAAGE